MPSVAHHRSDGDFLLCSVLAPLLLVLTLSEAAVAEIQDESKQPSLTSPSIPSSSPTSERLERQVRPRDPVETPPTEYLPYPPPDNYVWPPGYSPETQNPKPSEFDPPRGWYTGESGFSGTGVYGAYASGANPPLRPHILFHILASVLGSNARPIVRSHALVSQHAPPDPNTNTPLPISNDNSNSPPGAIPSLPNTPTTETTPLLDILSAILARNPQPVETPPTAYLPYPAPQNYQWPLGSSPQTQNPQPSEFDSPGGWYGGVNPGTSGPGGQGTAIGGSSATGNNGWNPGIGYGNGAGLGGKAGGNGGLSKGAIAGIAIGVPLALLLLAWAVWRTLKIRRRKREIAAQGGGAGGGPPMAEHGGGD